MYHPFQSPPTRKLSSTSNGVNPLSSSLPIIQAGANSNEPMNTMAGLPFEIILLILRNLDSTSDLLSCMLTCRSWCLCSVDMLWYRPRLDKLFSVVRISQTLRLEKPTFAYSTFIRRLGLHSVCHDVTDAALNHFRRCTSLEKITLNGCYRLTDESVTKIIAKNPKLSSLDLAGCELLTDTTLFEIAAHAKSIVGINLMKCGLITDEGLTSLAKACHMVRRIKIPFCQKVTDVGVEAVIENCPHIIELDLNNVPRISDKSIIQLSNRLQNLRELRLAFCQIRNPGTFSDLTCSAHLKILDLTDCEMVTDDMLGIIVRSAPRLRNLIISRCSAITDLGVNYISSLGKNLHYLHLGHCDRITDDSIISLCLRCVKLKYLDLACVTLLTDLAVAAIALLPKLKRIGLVKCSNITDRAIFELVHGQSTADSYYVCALERVHLSYCVNLSLRVRIRTHHPQTKILLLYSVYLSLSFIC